jgi:hypothetical protein
MTSWDEAAAHARAYKESTEDEAPWTPPYAAQTRIPEKAPAFIVTNRFEFSMIDLSGARGATVRVRSIPKLDVMELLYGVDAPVVSMDLRGQAFLEHELQLAAGPRPRVTPETKLIVGERAAWNDIKWYLIEYLADEDGCVK